MGIEITEVTIIKVYYIYSDPNANMIFNIDMFKYFLEDQDQGFPFSPLLLNIVLKSWLNQTCKKKMKIIWIGVMAERWQNKKYP